MSALLTGPVSRWRWIIAVAVAALIPVASVATPFLGDAGREAIMAGLSPLCHQLPGRSFHIGGVQLAVCHRCLGIYGGLALASVAFLVVAPLDAWINRRSRMIVVLSLVPLAIDWGAEFLIGWSGTPVSRLLTGGVFGVVAGYFLTRAITGTGRPTAANTAAGEEIGDGSPWIS